MGVPPKSSKSFDQDLALKPMVTWGSLLTSELPKSSQIP